MNKIDKINIAGTEYSIDGIISVDIDQIDSMYNSTDQGVYKIVHDNKSVGILFINNIVPTISGGPSYVTQIYMGPYKLTYIANIGYVGSFQDQTLGLNDHTNIQTRHYNSNARQWSVWKYNTDEVLDTLNDHDENIIDLLNSSDEYSLDIQNLYKKIDGYISGGNFISGVVKSIELDNQTIHPDYDGKVNLTGIIEDGKSAYELAVDKGYQDTEENWLNSLHGKSAYEIWQLQEGNEEKSLDDFWRYLTADKGYKKIPLTSESVRPTAAAADLDAIYIYPDPNDSSKSITAVSNGTTWIELFKSDGNIRQIIEEIESLKEDFERVPSIVSDITKAHVFVSESDDRSVINICDTNGNIVMSVRNGNVYVSKANTETLGSFKENNNGEFSISDQRGNVAFKVDENGVSFKKAIGNELMLDGVDVLQLINGLTQDTLKFLNTEEGDIIRLIDKRGYILAIISENGVTTKNSASSDVDITVANSDTISVIGSSFGETEGYGTTIYPTNKHWSGIVSLLLDYRIQNLSLSGSNKVTALYKIRKGDWKPAGKYCLVANDENFSYDSHQQTRALDNICKCLISLGIEPIICTSYHKDGCLSSAYKNYADEHNYMTLDAAHYCHDLNGGIVSAFDDGAHLRKRNIQMVADAYLPQLMRMENPMQSIKVFRARNTSINDLDELVFTSNVERAKVFREITVSNSSNVDEYNKLSNGSSLSFTKYALISCVLPAVGKDVGSVKLSFTTNDDNINVYAKNDMASPYPNPTNATKTRFSIAEEITIPSVGAVYTVGGSDYTVSEIVMGENNYYCTIYCNPSTLPSTLADGVMTKKSGQGEEQMLYALAEQATTSVISFIDADNNGHFVQLTKNDGIYKLPDGDGYIDYDKVNFLLVSSGSFTLADIHVICNVANKKQRKSRILFDWSENEELSTNELLSETTFGSVGTNTNSWKDDDNNSLTSQSSYGNKYPSGCSSLLRISDEVAMNYTVPSASLTKNGKIWLEICCRYFPTAPNPYTQANDTVINDDSYDYATLYVQFGQEAKKAIVKNEVGLMWKKVRVPITWYHPLAYSNIDSEALPIRLYASKELEVCKVSLKYEC